MRELETGMDLKRPSLSKEQVLALSVGDKIRDIPGYLYQVIGFVDGRYGRIAVLEYWHQRHERYAYRTASEEELSILYTPA